MWGAIIGAAGSLIGGAMQNKAAKSAANQERTWAVEDQAEQFVRLRAAAEKAGFNPLTALGAAPNPGMVNPTSAARQDYMGSAIQNSALMLADSMSKTNAAATGKKLQNANRANAALSSKLTAATLRPKMGGVFDRPTKFGKTSGQTTTAQAPKTSADQWSAWGVGTLEDFIPQKKPEVTRIWGPTVLADGSIGTTATQDSPDAEQIAGAFLTEWMNGAADRREVRKAALGFIPQIANTYDLIIPAFNEFQNFRKTVQTPGYQSKGSVRMDWYGPGARNQDF
jgi:hypothetical protein